MRSLIVELSYDAADKFDKAMAKWNEDMDRAHNKADKPFIWTKTADEIFASLARFCKRISDSGH